MKKLALIGIVLLLIAANARQTPIRHMLRAKKAPTPVQSSVRVMSHDLAELDSSLTVLSQMP